MFFNWVRKTIDRNLVLVFWVCAIVLLLVFIVNRASRAQGTYTNYNDLIRDVMFKPFSATTDYATRDVTPLRPLKEGESPVSSSNTSKGEAECKRAIEHITGKPFSKSRPIFLKNEVTGHLLELDCYNPELGLAVEYNGIQHYQFTPMFHKTKDAFFNTKYRDRIKAELCEKAGVTLIVVPYTVGLKEIAPFLRMQVAKRFEHDSRPILM
jgi:hypothetical protein